MKRREFLGTLGAAATAWDAALGDAPPAKPVQGKTFVSRREDGRFVETAGFVHKYLETLRPRLEFRPGMSRPQFAAWQAKVRAKLLELMCFPDVPPQPAPRRIWSQARDGYRLERWEFYPEPYSVVPYLLLVPAGASQQSPAPAVVCFPGSTGSKEALAGEPVPAGCPQPDKSKWDDNRMAFHYARRGMVALAVDSPATNELAVAASTSAGSASAAAWPQRTAMAMNALWMGRSYEAISVFQKACLLQWLVREPYVDAKRLATSGHSLGAKPADILGVLYPGLVKAVVHNDFVCHWQERAVAQNLNDPGAHQVVPGIFQWFDYTDLEATLAPCPLLFTEGGRPNQIAKIRTAYALCGASEAIQLHQYETYSDPQSRTLDKAELPIGISSEEYFRYAYVTPSLHRFRPNHAVPWLAKVFEM